MSFIETPEQRQRIDLAATVLAFISLILAIFILVSASLIWRNKKARRQIDRISFRLCLWAMCAQVVYDIAHIIIFAPTGLVHYTTAGCAAGMTIRVSMLGLVNYLFTCTAVNLMLTIVFGITPVDYNLERYYVGISVTLAIIVPLIAACLGHFGYDPIFFSCYFAYADRDTRIKHFMTDLYMWQALSCIIATISVVVTMAKLYKSSRTTRKAAHFASLTSGPDIDLNVHECPHTPSPASSTSSGPFTRLFVKPEGGCGCLSNARGPDMVVMTMYQLQDKLKSIALKISLYPIALIVINTIVTTGDVYTAVTHGVHTEAAYVLAAIHRALCGGRGIIFGALCIFVDPCLFRGLRILREEWKSRKSEHIELRDSSQRHAKDEKIGYNAVTAVPHIDYTSYSPTYIPPGETPHELLNDPFSLDASGGKEWSIGDPSNFGQTTALSTLPCPDERRRKSSTMSLDFAQALAFAPGLSSKRASTASMGFASALGISAPEHSSSKGWSKRFGSQSNQNAGPSPTNAWSAYRNGTPQKDNPDSIGHSTRRNPSTMTMDIGQILTAGPPQRRDSSLVSMDMTQMLQSGPVEQVAPPQQETYPPIWGKTFDSVSEIGLDAPMSLAERKERARRRREEKDRKELMRGLEKLYEEAESQL